MADWDYYSTTRTGRDRWKPRRIGQVAKATTAPGTAPAYGSAIQLGSAALDLDHTTFAAAMRDLNETTQQDILRRIEDGTIGSLHDMELDIAFNHARLGRGMPSEDFRNTGEDANFWDDVLTGFNLAKSEVGSAVQGAASSAREASRFIPVVGGYLPFVEDEEDQADSEELYEEYTKANGALTEEEFKSFPYETQVFLHRRAKGTMNLTEVAQLPGISHALYGLGMAYRGVTTAAEMQYRAADHLGIPAIGPGAAVALPVALKDIYFSGDQWSQAWKESSRKSLGNALVDSVISPFHTDEELTDIRKNSSLYDISSAGTEFIGTWYADAGVVAGKALGNLGRVARKEVPLGQGEVAREVHQILSGQEVTTGGRLTRRYASWRAENIKRGREGVEEYARSVSAAEFARLPMFRNHRTTGGAPAAFALHKAINGLEAPDGQDLLDLTWGVFHADPKALATVRKMSEDPGELARWGPNAQTFIDAYDAVRTKASQLESELDNLTLAEGSDSLTPFHRWEVHADILVKQEQLRQATDALNNYGDYGAWLDSVQHGIHGAQVKGPSKVLRWNDVHDRKTEGVRRTFLDTQYGWSHTIESIPRATWTRKANVAFMDDLDSGVRAINNQFDQFRQLGFDDMDSRDAWVDAWMRAETNTDRYRVMYDMEETLVDSVVARRLDLDPEIIKVVREKIRAEQNRAKRGLLTGQGQVYDTAPSLGQRVFDELDTDVQLIARDPERNMATLNVIDGKTMRTFEVPDEALELHTSPLDTTQTPRVFQPIDVRRFYLEAKRHRDVLDALDAGAFRRGGADAMQVIDVIGTKFHNMWKPAQLWRPAWPMRVMMDEGFRAMAIFGPMYWLTGPGAEQLGTIARNIPYELRQAAQRVRRGPLDLATPSPLNRAQRRHPSPFQRDVEISEAVQVPDIRWPALNEERLSKLHDEFDALDRYTRAGIAMRAIPEERGRQLERQLDDTMGKSGRRSVTAEMGRGPRRAEVQPTTQDPAELAGEMRMGKYLYPAAQRAVDRRTELQPIVDASGIRKIRATERRYRAVATPDDFKMRIYDPISGKEVKGGYAVPIFTAGSAKPTKMVRDGFANEAMDDPNFYHWLKENEELLARKGMRIMVDDEGRYHIVRWYASRKGAFQNAKNFLLDVEHTGLPEGQEHAWMLDLNKKGQVHVQSRDDLSKIYEDVHKLATRREDWSGLERREFVSGPEYERQPGLGEAPAEEVGEVFHGTQEGLPDELLPRDEVPILSGNMMGRGLYTTVDLDVVRQYAGGDVRNIYTIRGSRSGQRYDVFDMDQPMTDADMDEFRGWMEDNRHRLEWSDSFDYDGPTDNVAEMFDWLERSRYLATRTMEVDGAETPTWAQWMEAMDGYPDYQERLTEFLETRRNAGVLTHRGGTSYGDGHQVYVWLHPEDIEVVPAYAPTNEFRTTQDWFYDPLSQERLVEVPEDRIVRYGPRNPALRRLHTIHAKRLELEKDLKGSQKLKNQTRRDLIAEEKELMRALGLEYAEGSDVHSAQETSSDAFVVAERAPADFPNRMGQDWYNVVDNDRWRRMVSEAEAMDAERDRAIKAQAGLDPDRLEDSVLNMDTDLWRYVRNFEESIDDPQGWLANHLNDKREFGEGYATLRTADGRDIKVKNVFEDHDGRQVRGLVSSAKTIDFLSEGHGRALDMMQRRGMRQKVYSPPALDTDTLRRGTQKYQKAVLYYQKWADVLNDTIARSPVYGRMLNGQSDEQVVDWLMKTHEGAKFRKEIFYEGQSPELFVMEARDRLDYYLPEKWMQRELAKRPLKPSDLKRGIHEADRPDVMGSDVDPAERRWWTKLADNMWHAMGTVPIDKLSRHPTAKAFYDMKMRQLVSGTKSDVLTPELLDQYRKIAHDYTTREIRATLFDLSDQTNFTDMIRFMAPFWNAQEEAITKWLRITLDRPETMARFFNGQRAIYKNFVVVDEDGREVESTAREGGFLGIYNPDDRVIVQIPEWMDMGSLKHFGSVAIPIESANTAFQGEFPLFPGTGPMVTVPIDKFLRWASDTHGVTHSEEGLYRWLFPVGRPTGGWRGVMEQMFPGWGRRLQSATGPENDISKVNMRFLIEREMRLDAERKGLPMPTDAEVKEATNFMWSVRFFTSWAAPVQTQFRPKHQFWLDQAHEFRRKYGAAYMDAFIAEYGAEAAAYAVSSSSSMAGIPPTVEGMENFEQHRGLISKYPNWGSAIVDPNSFLDDYSQDAYEAQFEVPIGAGQPGSLRQLRSTKERFDYAQERVGWIEFRKFNSALQAEMFSRGLTNLNQSGAEDLRKLKAATINRFAHEYPAWYESYSNWSNDIYSRIRELEEIAFRKEFDHRPDMLGVRQYLQIRAAAGERLDVNYDQGGSRSLQSDENGALRMWFYDQVGQLIQDNPAFGEFYSRYLDGDTLELGSGLYGVSAE